MLDFVLFYLVPLIISLAGIKLYTEHNTEDRDIVLFQAIIPVWNILIAFICLFKMFFDFLKWLIK